MPIGTLTYPKGKYEGEIFHGMRNGWGINTSEEEIQEGNWYDNTLYGRCILKFSNGNKYEGFIRLCKRNGWGKFTWANGTSHEGNWYDDVQDGQMLVTLANGDTHNEFWHKGQLKYTIDLVVGTVNPVVGTVDLVVGTVVKEQ